jgi:hypothetical protein
MNDQKIIHINDMNDLIIHINIVTILTLCGALVRGGQVYTVTGVSKVAPRSQIGKNTNERR